MRAVLQRVAGASVEVDGQAVGSIDRGLLVFIGVAQGDGLADAEAVASKIADLRIFSDDQGKMNLSVGEVDGSVLVVSQFTLYGDVRRGRRPSFTGAAGPDIAEPLVEAVASRLRARGLPVKSGRFGAKMEVSLVNDGPVTVIVEARGGRIV